MSCAIGSKALIAHATIDSELSTPAAEWMSDVFHSHIADDPTACIIFDLKLEEAAKKLKVKLIYQDGNNTTRKASLLEYSIRKKPQSWSGSLEFHVKNVHLYQVCMFRPLIKMLLQLKPMYSG